MTSTDATSGSRPNSNAVTFTESVVEEAALDWLRELGYGVAHGEDIAPDAPKSERASFSPPCWQMVHYRQEPVWR